MFLHLKVLVQGRKDMGRIALSYGPLSGQYFRRFTYVDYPSNCSYLHESTAASSTRLRQSQHASRAA